MTFSKTAVWPFSLLLLLDSMTFHPVYLLEVTLLLLLLVPSLIQFLSTKSRLSSCVCKGVSSVFRLEGDSSFWKVFLIGEDGREELIAVQCRRGMLRYLTM